MASQSPHTSIILVAIIVGAASILSILSFQYSNSVSAQILNVASEDAKSAAKIQAHDLSIVLANKVESVSNNLELLAASQMVQSKDVQAARSLFTAARKSTGDFASSYFWVDKDGKLLWADAFENQTIAEQYIGADRSNRDYFLIPKDTLTPYYTTVIESVDNVPRLYIGYPIASEGAGVTSFNGVVAAAINPTTIGNFMQDQLAPGYKSSVGLLDRNGIILSSSSSPQYHGKNIFDPEIQSIIPVEIKDPFNNFIRESLQGKTGAGDFTSRGITSTIAYQPVVIRDFDFAVLYVVVPHELASNAVALLDQQKFLNATIIIAIALVSGGISALVLTWNRRLSKEIDKKISELKVANESLLESNKQLQVANTKLGEANKLLEIHDKMQTEFVNIAAHELRTPVQPLLGIAEQLEEDLGNGVKEVKIARPEIEMLARNAKRLSQLTTDILEVSRIESNSVKLKKERIDLKEKIQKAMEDTKSFIDDGKKLKIIFEEASREPIIVKADKVRLFEVLSNLIRNAIKFTHEGVIIVRAEETGDGHAKVSVTDTGKGIDNDMFPKLFTKFATQSETGTGLGLYISKNIIEAHGGRIWAENNADGGATFTFSLPMAKSEAQEARRN